MSHTGGYYAAEFIAALHGLAWLAFLICWPLSAYLFYRGMLLEQKQKPTDEPLGALVDWTDGGKLKKRAVLIFFVVAPILYVAYHMLPDHRTAMIHMGFPQDVPCMLPNESGVLVAGRSQNNTGWFSFRMKDGVTIMCRVDDMNAGGTSRNATYSVTQGRRVS